VVCFFNNVEGKVHLELLYTHALSPACLMRTKRDLDFDSICEMIKAK
jgi:hypothetical protein